MRMLRRTWLRGGLWQRLMLLVIGTVLLMWLAVALTSLVFARFQRDFADLAAAQVPRIALTGELAGQSARLTTIATRIIGADGASAELVDELEAVSSGLEESLKTILAGAQGGGAARIAALRRQIAALMPLTQQRRDQSEAMVAQLDALRWLNVDIQNEVDPLLSDYDFNIRAKMLELEAAHDEPQRARLLQQIGLDRSLRDNVLQIGVDAGTVVTLLLQASVASDPRQVEQLEDLGFDMLARLTERMTDLPEGDEFLTLRQSLGLLRQSFDLTGGLIAQRRDMLTLQARIYGRIETVQQGLSALQDDLARLSQSEKEQVLIAISRGVAEARWAMAGLAILTLVLAVAGLALVFGVMRRRIVVPLRDLTSRMLKISERSGSRIRGRARGDEIARIRAAVDDFARTIEARDNAIAELKQTQADLVQAGKMAALGNLSAGISHELNQPLAALRYRLVLLDEARQSGNDTEAARQLDRVADLGDRMQAIISHLGRFARRAGSRREPLSLADSVEDAISLLKNRFETAGLQPRIGPGIAAARVLGIEVLVEQVIVNLLTNALDAIADNPEGAITIDATLRDGMIDLTVQDNGIGLGDLSSEDALNPFVTSKEAGRGMGLGLSISYNIARDLGGDLQLAPVAGGGVIAHFRLQPTE